MRTFFEIGIALLADPAIQTALVSLLLALLGLAAAFLGLPVWLIAVIRIIIEKAVPIAVGSLAQDNKVLVKQGLAPVANDVIHGEAVQKVLAKIPGPFKLAAKAVMPALKEEITESIKTEVGKLNAERDAKKLFAAPSRKEMENLLGS